MGKNARSRKLRWEAQRHSKLNPSKMALAREYQRKYPQALVRSVETGEKMSQVLEEFAQPLLRDAQSLDELKKALLVAMVAWNHSLLDEAAAAESEMASRLFANPNFRPVLNALIARKKQLYPHNRRFILDYELVADGAGLQLNVVSSWLEIGAVGYPAEPSVSQTGTDDQKS
jgi:hypothetical protein